jgi:hypothetical protein
MSMSVARGQPGYDPLFKIQPVLRNVTTKFHIVYTLQECMTTVEYICAFQGCIHFRVYMKGKLHKYGMKREVGTFKSWKCMLAHTTETNHNSSFSVADRLHEPTKNMRYTVYMD